MKVILRNYGVGMTTSQKQAAKSQAINMVLTRGTGQKPQPPRDILAQSGPRGILLNWRLPSGFSADIAGWRVYKDNESTLFSQINDPNTTQHFIDSTAGSTPPVTNFFVSSLNNLGVESAKVMVQANALTESGAPTLPSTPPTYNTGFVGGSGSCFTGETRIKTIDGWKEFRELGPEVRIVNETGTWIAEVLVHDNRYELVIPLGSGRVNLIHGIKWEGEYKPAGEIFSAVPRKMFKGRLYNLHVHSKNEEDHHFIVEPGYVAHNYRPIKS